MRYGLTEREREAVEHVAAARTNAEAARLMGCSEKTVKELLLRARAKMRVPDSPAINKRVAVALKWTRWR